MSKSSQKVFLEKWEQVALIISGVILLYLFVIELHCNCLFERYSISFSILVGIATGMMTTVLLFYFQRKHHAEELKRFYMSMQGHYIRLMMGQDNLDAHKSENLICQNFCLNIKLKYDESKNCLFIEEEVWKLSQENIGIVHAYIEFESPRRNIGYGRYKHVKGKHKGNFGTYTLHRFEENSSRLIVLYQHIFPRNKKNDADNNRGWQIWKKLPLN